MSMNERSVVLGVGPSPVHVRAVRADRRVGYDRLAFYRRSA
jgi:hypothetical protein